MSGVKGFNRKEVSKHDDIIIRHSVLCYIQHIPQHLSAQSDSSNNDSGLYSGSV